MWRKLSLAALMALVVAPVLRLSPASALTISPLTLEYELKPGEAVVGTVKLRNEGAVAETFYPFVNDMLAGDEAGTPTFTASNPGHSVVDWITFEQQSITLEPGGFVNVVYNLTVPKSTSPGGYYGALLFTTAPPSLDKSAVGAAGATGPLLLVTVAGKVVEKGSVTDFVASPASVSSLPVDFGVRFQNAGTVHVKPTGVIRITNMFGGTSAVIPVNEEGGNVLPDSGRVFSASWMEEELPAGASELVKEWKNFGFGPYTATLIMNYGQSNQVASATTSFWVMPWMMVVLFIIFLVVLAMLVMQYNKWILAKAQKRR
jgi:hypothetical protein